MALDVVAFLYFSSTEHPLMQHFLFFSLHIYHSISAFIHWIDSKSNCIDDGHCADR